MTADAPVTSGEPRELRKRRALAARNLPAKTPGHQRLGERTSAERENGWNGLHLTTRHTEGDGEIEDRTSVRRVRFNTCLPEHRGCSNLAICYLRQKLANVM